MFTHDEYDIYTFENIPKDRDVYILDEIYIDEYDQMMVQFFNGSDCYHVGYVMPVAVRKTNSNSLELSWYPNTNDRFHEVSIRLPRDQFVACVGCWKIDEKPHIFVRSEWLEKTHICVHSTFAMVDAIGVKSALEKGLLTREKLISLRNRIDVLATEHPNVSFISFADNLLLKSNWRVGHYASEVDYDYEPEIFIHLTKKINQIYQEYLGLSVYSSIAQGANEYYEDELLYISDSKNHISLNSLGVPFAQIMEMEGAARKAIKSGVHLAADLYMDQSYYHSLKFKYGFEKTAMPNNNYTTKMIAGDSKYYYSDTDEILSNLR